MQAYSSSQRSQAQMAPGMGLLYCATTQAAYVWLGELLADRGLAVRKERELLPGDRLLRERTAQALSELFLVWPQKTQLDEEGSTIFSATQQHVRQLIASAPLRERPGCAQCPVRCSVLPLTAPYFTALEKLVATRMGENLSSSTKLEIMRRTAEQQVKTLSSYRENKALYQGMLYCLLTNIQVPPETEANRDELLKLLR